MTEILLSLCVGLALSASSGFRVFVPMLVANLGAKFGILHLTNGFDWMGSNTATIVFATATVVEIAAYYIPVLDNFLDTLAAPASLVAGTILTSSFLPIDSPVLKYGLGILAGGGMAGTIQAGTGLLRLASTKFTAGFGNSFLSSFENVVSISSSLLTLWVPVFMAVLAILLFVFLLKKLITNFTRNS